MWESFARVLLGEKTSNHARHSWASLSPTPDGSYSPHYIKAVEKYCSNLSCVKSYCERPTCSCNLLTEVQTIFTSFTSEDKVKVCCLRISDKGMFSTQVWLQKLKTAGLETLQRFKSENSCCSLSDRLCSICLWDLTPCVKLWGILIAHFFFV